MPSSRKVWTSQTRSHSRELAHDLGVAMPDESDHTGVLADWHEGERRGVLGSPHFFCGDADLFCPSLDITKDPVKGVSIVRDTLRLRMFLDRCLPGAAKNEVLPPGSA